MPASTTIRLLAVLLLATAAVLWIRWMPPTGDGAARGELGDGSQRADAELEAAPKRPKPPPSEVFFARAPVVRLEITIEGPELSRLYADPREYVRATVREGGKVWEDVGVHLKGAAGSYRHFDDKPALTLNFDKYRDEQRFHGLDKLHLNNSVQDPSYLSELLCGELFRAAKVPAPRVAHARVVLNDRDRGLYVLKEGFDRRFLRRWFEDKTGDLYDGGFLNEIDHGLEKTSGDDPYDTAALDALASAAREHDLERRRERLLEKLDVDRFLSFVALETLTWHWDGYAMKRNNYRLYHDPTTSRFVFLPHGMDQMFRDAHGPIQPRARGLVARAVLEIPEWNDAYLDRVQLLLESVLTPEWAERRIDSARAALLPALEDLPSHETERIERSISHLRSRVLRRIRFARERIAELRSTADPAALAEF